MHPTIEYALLFFLSAGVSGLYTPVAAFLANASGAIAIPRARDVHEAPTPRLGGLAIFAAFGASLFAARSLPTLRVAFEQDRSVPAAALAAGVLVLLGALDDRFQLGSGIKFLSQIAASAMAVAIGSFAPVALYVPGIGSFFLSETQGLLLGVGLSVVIINAVNFIDGLDGLAAGVLSLSALLIFGNCFRLARLDYLDVTAAPSILSVALAGALAGFLVFNFAPAKIFMGDSGSMAVGLILSLSLMGSVSRISPDQLTSAHSAVPVFAIVPMLVVASFGFPVLDLVLAIGRRGLRRTSLFQADKQHLHHWLLNRFGGSVPITVLSCYLIVAIVDCASLLALNY